MNAIRQTIKSLLTACLPRERWLVRGRRTPCTAGPAISLTFDDGPHPEITPQVLDRLQTYGWKGTFFVVGEKAAAYPELVRRIVQEGHELGNHSYTHAEPSQTTAQQFLTEVRQTQALLRELTGKHVTLMRPPKGELNWNKLWGSWRTQQTIAMWNVDPKDYRPNCAAELLRWSMNYTPHWGDIVLLHDVHPQVLKILDALQEYRRFVGVETVTLSRWLCNGSLADKTVTSKALQSASTEGITCP